MLSPFTPVFALCRSIGDPRFRRLAARSGRRHQEGDVGAGLHRAHPRRRRPAQAQRAPDQVESRRRLGPTWHHLPQTSHFRYVKKTKEDSGGEGRKPTRNDGQNRDDDDDGVKRERKIRVEKRKAYTRKRETCIETCLCLSVSLPLSPLAPSPRSVFAGKFLSRSRNVNFWGGEKERSMRADEEISSK